MQSAAPDGSRITPDHPPFATPGPVPGSGSRPSLPVRSARGSPGTRGAAAGQRPARNPLPRATRRGHRLVMPLTPTALVRRLQEICGNEYVFWRPEDLLVWEYDAGFDRRPPSAVVLPGTAEEVADVVRAAREAGAALRPRGAGTGAVGAAVPSPAL